MKRYAILFILAAMSFASCKTEFDKLLMSGDTEAKYKAAFQYYNDEKYQKAAQLFESISVITQGTERDDTVQYYLGMSNYKYRDYYTAETNFSRFLQVFPNSPFSSAASFFRIDCLFRQTLRYELDQTPTYAAIAAISEYLLSNPDSDRKAVCLRMLDELGERLDRKAFEGARLYYKMEDYKAARVALKNVLKDDAENQYREEILYYTAMASYKYAFNSVASKQKERYMVFRDDYLNFIGEYPESSHRKELDALYQKAKSK